MVNICLESLSTCSLFSFLSSAGRKSKASQPGYVEKPLNHVYMPPELLLILDVPVYAMKTFYLLPSLLHRLESLMLASQLRAEINCQIGNFHIPSSLVCLILT